ncbi:hypothetical protein [Aureimonas ureilytica]|uniref:hypothetical protein n=1 Tax=Aureimonas ureilytica TaxID=401562 RepID=UPI00037F9993|nr:hypothetical protein [Aureimonas ureilytica]
MKEEIEELEGRVDGLRLILAVLIAEMPNRYDVIHKLQKTEAAARQRNLPTGVLRELADLRGALDEL